MYLVPISFLASELLIGCCSVGLHFPQLIFLHSVTATADCYSEQLMVIECLAFLYIELSKVISYRLINDTLVGIFKYLYEGNSQ